MYNESAYKAIYGEMVRLACPFEKVILSRCADCELAQKLNIAEREAVACRSVAASEHCTALRGLMHQNALFALKLSQPVSALPHAKEMKIQCGGLLGIRRLLDPDAPRCENIHAMTESFQASHENLSDLPWSEIVKEITAFKGRRS